MIGLVLTLAVVVVFAVLAAGILVGGAALSLLRRARARSQARPAPLRTS
ncbi:MAG: hypothetical protein M3155_05870 [Actinomycetota bacterium]|nr:hypothetical protein [Actinomycetota bacterium]